MLFQWQNHHLPSCMTCACFLLLHFFLCQSSLCSRCSWVTGRERALLVLHLLMYLGITLHLLLFNNLQWKSSLILLQVHGMPHRKSSCWMSVSYRWHSGPSAPRYSQPEGEKNGKETCHPLQTQFGPRAAILSWSVCLKALWVLGSACKMNSLRPWLTY